jgi:plasmid stability protein
MRIGQHHTGETKSKISAANKGKIRTIETKIKLSLSHKGIKFPGRHLSLERREKIRAAMKGKSFTVEHKEKIAASMTGKHRTSEAKAKIRAALLGKSYRIGWHHTPESKKKLSEAKRGKHCRYPFTVEHKEKLSISKSGEKNPAWNGGISKTGYNFEFDKLKIKIRRRDRFICFICGKKEKEKAHAVHHIDYNKLSIEPNNLITLCHSCHNRTNWRRDNWINYFKNVPRQQGLFL